MKNPNYKILFVGGGTGGHVTPLIAVIEELLTSGVPSSSIFLVTDRESARMDYHCWQVSPERAASSGGNDKLSEASGRGCRGRKPKAVYVLGHQIEVHIITGGKFNRFFTFENLLTPFKVIAGFFQSLGLLRKIRPDVILAKGAYLSAPLVYAASLLHLPIYLHESDSVMGTTNMRLAKYAQKIFVSFPLEYYDDELKDKLIESGLPIRRRFFNEEPFEVNTQYKKILIWGGSQGADRLNRLIIERLPDYLKNYELYHICGEKNLGYCERAKSNFTSELQSRYHLYGFLGREIEKVVAVADLVISRSGATSLFELAAIGKAVIAIPYPISASNHQYKNAEYFEKKGAVVLLEEKDLDDKELMNEIFSLMENNIERNDLRKNILNLAPKDAARVVANNLL
ncbi:MAG: UDP-N-acetylglucosamine--N-acetylmuramyl-(pentapeptide) pyrophosphoryl-undecaprenol N-acetylglucosamine transferase [Candidatus Berkelbacteria bacterium]|nr:UDP-N-acetylglucosamine--N-acetylmuramyl-(pentapeptide) pyrophosphoryl-undecaprenol N-acetylglucosamine transferase [Candidatus Berkelbacteria bacterium]